MKPEAKPSRADMLAAWRAAKGKSKMPSTVSTYKVPSNTMTKKEAIPSAQTLPRLSHNKDTRKPSEQAQRQRHSTTKSSSSTIGDVVNRINHYSIPSTSDQQMAENMVPHPPSLKSKSTSPCRPGDKVSEGLGSSLGVSAHHTQQKNNLQGHDDHTAPSLLVARAPLEKVQPNIGTNFRMRNMDNIRQSDDIHHLGIVANDSNLLHDVRAPIEVSGDDMVVQQLKISSEVKNDNPTATNAAAGSTDINKMESTNVELQKIKNDVQEEPKMEVKDEERSDREQEDIARLQKGEETESRVAPPETMKSPSAKENELQKAKIKNRRRRRTTMFIKGSATPDDKSSCPTELLGRCDIEETRRQQQFLFDSMREAEDQEKVQQRGASLTTEKEKDAHSSSAATEEHKAVVDASGESRRLNSPGVGGLEGMGIVTARLSEVTIACGTGDDNCTQNGEALAATQNDDAATVKPETCAKITTQSICSTEATEEDGAIVDESNEDGFFASVSDGVEAWSRLSSSTTTAMTTTMGVETMEASAGAAGYDAFGAGTSSRSPGLCTGDDSSEIAGELQEGDVSELLEERGREVAKQFTGEASEIEAEANPREEGGDPVEAGDDAGSAVKGTLESRVQTGEAEVQAASPDDTSTTAVSVNQFTGDCETDAASGVESATIAKETSSELLEEPSVVKLEAGNTADHVTISTPQKHFTTNESSSSQRLSSLLVGAGKSVDVEADVMCHSVELDADARVMESERRADEAEARLAMALEEQDALRFFGEVLKQRVTATEAFAAKAIDKAQRSAAKEAKVHRQALEALETKHAAYTEALTTQMKQGLLAAVKQCKVLEKELTTEREARKHCEEVLRKYENEEEAEMETSSASVVEGDETSRNCGEVGAPSVVEVEASQDTPLSDEEK